MRLELYHSYIDTADRALTERLWAHLPPSRREELAPRTPASRAEGAGLTALLTHALEQWQTASGTAFQTVPATALTRPFARWEVAPNGKPFPAGISTPQGVVFVSFSHSNGHLLAAVCDRPLGADIQAWEAPAFAPDRFSRTAARITHPDESLPAAPREVARRFAAKEAALKLSGDGLRRALCLVAVGEDETDGASLHFCEKVSDCIIAVAVSR
ncbi:MAG: 4'-phosphopantetheinyl transferase superfamily protein [Ruminococcaceae bacterium]|nr:4'-phosphopantetheinyl transferase superfamily protein [Oscillospiraceae bacterium]